MSVTPISSTRPYKILSGMKVRCYNPNNPRYKWYGGRGIKVCDEWLGKNGAVHFVEWAMKNGYRNDLTIDRIDPEGDYSPDNCRWISAADNSARTSICKSEYREAMIYLEMHTDDVIKLSFCKDYAKIELRDGNILKFDKKPVQKIRRD